MADVNYITDKNGNKVNIADLTARTNASTALLESEYNRQLADNVYAGRDISTITALASEITSAGSIPAFLNARAKAGNFNGLRIGDWTDIVLSSGVTMRYQIAAFDHYYNCADAAMGHHIVMVPTSPRQSPATTPSTEATSTGTPPTPTTEQPTRATRILRATSTPGKPACSSRSCPRLGRT